VQVTRHLVINRIERVALRSPLRDQLALAHARPPPGGCRDSGHAGRRSSQEAPGSGYATAPASGPLHGSLVAITGVVLPFLIECRASPSGGCSRHTELADRPKLLTYQRN
jgi:hypothetical protein